MKGTLDDDVTEADIISCVEFNQDGELLATGDKGGRVVIFQVKQTKINQIQTSFIYSIYHIYGIRTLIGMNFMKQKCALLRWAMKFESA